MSLHVCCLEGELLPRNVEHPQRSIHSRTELNVKRQERKLNLQSRDKWSCHLWFKAYVFAYQPEIHSSEGLDVLQTLASFIRRHLCDISIPKSVREEASHSSWRAARICHARTLDLVLEMSTSAVLVVFTFDLDIARRRVVGPDIGVAEQQAWKCRGTQPCSRSEVSQRNRAYRSLPTSCAWSRGTKSTIQQRWIRWCRHRPKSTSNRVCRIHYNLMAASQ